LKEASDGPGSKGQVCELDEMLAEYYEERGWENGVAPESKLKELEISSPAVKFIAIAKLRTPAG
jgi:aldehyde:ferredoxin oxidoreductase